MSEIKFEDVKVGDRVRLVHEGGNETTVSVTDVCDGWIYSETIAITDCCAWHVAEILPKPVVLPTGENAMVAHPTDPSRIPFVRMGHAWNQVFIDTVRVVSGEEVQKFIRDDGFEVVFEGVQGDE